MQSLPKKELGWERVDFMTEISTMEVESLKAMSRQLLQMMKLRLVAYSLGLIDNALKVS